MRKITVLGVIFLFFSCKATKQTSNKFNSNFNENIETYFLVEILSIEHRKTNKQWEKYKLKTCREHQPIVAKALEKYGHLTTHKIAIETAKLNDTLNHFNIGNEIMMPALLEQPEFKLLKNPGAFKFSKTHLKADEKLILEDIISNYLKDLYNFYLTENIGVFFKDNINFYNGAANELASFVPKGFIGAIENYYGDKRSEYNAIVSPMMIWPVEDNYGRGISATVKSNDKLKVNQVISPYKEVAVLKPNEAYENFGYDYKLTAQFFTVHEFSHSFVNSELEIYREDISKTAHLFTNKLKKKMRSKGVLNWHTHVIESFVRLGELRIAESQKDKDRADYYRDYHTNVEHFIFLPLLEEKIIEFENNRERYPMWKDFIPELLKVFESKNEAFVNEALNKNV